MYKADLCSNPSVLDDNCPSDYLLSNLKLGNDENKCVEKICESKEEVEISYFSDLNMQESASIMNKVTANFPERFLDWSDEQRKIAYAFNFKLYMEKFLDTIPSFTATWWSKYLNEFTNSLI